MSATTRRRTVFAAIGVTAGIASAIGFTTAPVQAAEPGSAGSAASPEVLKAPPPSPALDAVGTCFSWTQVFGFHGNTRAFTFIPTTARNNNVRDCILQQGNQGEGVFKLQDAINRCYPQFSAGVGSDSIYGSNTARAVREIQSSVGVTVDGVYGAETKTAMNWPHYRASDNAFLGCGLVRV